MPLRHRLAHAPAAREAARRTQCVNNLTQLILAVQNYESSYRVYPPGTLNEKGPILSLPQGYHHNWLSQILPYLEEQNTFHHIDFSVGVYDKKNEPVRQIQIATIRCPSEPFTPQELAISSYAGVHHDVDALHGARQTRLVADVADEEPHLRKAVLRVVLGHLVLLQLVARVHDDALDSRIPLQDGGDEPLAERTGPPGDEQ